MSWLTLGVTVLYFFLGALWYGPLFGNAWLKLTKVNPNGDPPVKALLASFVGGFIALSILKVVVELHETKGWADGAAIGVVAGVFDAAVQFCHPLFEGRSLGIYFIASSYHTTAFIMAGAIFAHYG